MTSPSVQGVRPTERELAHSFVGVVSCSIADFHGERCDRLTAAITRDREQGRAEADAEIARLRDALKRLEAMHTFYCRVGPVDECMNCGRRYLEHDLLSSVCLAAPLAPATAGMKEEMP